jgi:ElaA protein
VSPSLHRASFSELTPPTLYDILRLRSQVFVVEQQCVFLDQDGRDADPDTVHWWAEDHGAVVCYLRILRGEGAAELGRMVTNPAFRGRGLAGALVAEALAATGRPVVIKAQSRLVPWYMSFGFACAGPQFDEDGQPHTPMRLDE